MKYPCVNMHTVCQCSQYIVCTSQVYLWAVKEFLEKQVIVLPHQRIK